MIKQILLITTGTVLLFSGCAQLNTIQKSKEMANTTKTYNEVNQVVERTDKELDKADKPKETYNQSVESFTKTLKNKDATKNISDANETIRTVLTLIACAPKNIDKNASYKNKLYPYVTKNSSSKKIIFPIKARRMAVMQGECFNVEKISRYKQLNSNRLTFDVLYGSSVNVIKTSIQYKMVKDKKSKKWLFQF